MAEKMDISTDGTDPATWDPDLDGVIAAPKSHDVIYEDDFIRIVSVTVPPGMVQEPHHHRYPSVFVVDRPVKLRDFHGATHEEILRPNRDNIEYPFVRKSPPQGLHYVENVDTQVFHATRIEYKRGFPPGR
jgi:predicted metal-dependent enzyme (double-stranded beta helix superfamily)